MNKVFYHFTVTPLLKGVPKLIAKIVSSSKKVLIVCENEEQMLTLDDELWTFSTKEFIPHDVASCEFPSLQPVLLTTDCKENSNSASVLVVYNKLIKPNSNFEKCVYVFYGNSDEENVISMMSEYKALQVKPNKSVLWQQLNNGQWSAVDNGRAHY